MQAQGVVAVSKVNDYGYGSIKLDGQDTWFSAGKGQPHVQPGDVVQFIYTVNEKGYANVDPSQIMVTGKQAPPQQGGYGGNKGGYKGKKGGGGYKGGGKSTEEKDYWKKKQLHDERNSKRIGMQASRNSAIAFVDVLLKNEAFTLPSKKADRLDVAKALLDEITVQFYNQTANLEGTCDEFNNTLPEQQQQAITQQVQQQQVYQQPQPVQQQQGFQQQPIQQQQQVIHQPVQQMQQQNYQQQANIDYDDDVPQ